MSPYRWSNVKRYKRYARWPDGTTRTCTRCGADPERQRRRAAKLTADLRHQGSRYRTPVAYCELHIPEELET